MEKHNRMMSSDGVAITTVAGVVVATEVLMPIATPFMIVVLTVAWVIRLIEKSSHRRENSEKKPSKEVGIVDMDIFPPTRRHPFMPSVAPTDPITEFARVEPRIDHDVLLTCSQDRMIVNIANSSIATEFARQGKGTVVDVQHYCTLFTKGIRVVIHPA